MGKKLLYRILLTAIVVVTSVFHNDSLRYGLSTDGPDVWEYQTVAVNFSEYGEFPTMGFIGDEPCYQTNILEGNTLSNYMKCRFSTPGPLVYLAKPPAYPFILGLVYKIFGANLKYAYNLNLLFFIGIVFVLIGMGQTINNDYGVLLGVLAGLLFGTQVYHSLSDVLPAIMMTFFFACIAWVGVLVVKTPTHKKFSLMGIMIGLGLLTKGDISFIAILIPICLAFFLFRIDKLMTKMVIMFLSVALVLLPWVIYANYLRVNTQTERVEWKQKLLESEQVCELDTSKREEWENRGSIIENKEYHSLATHFYSRYAIGDKMVIISNQVNKDEWLSVHNEFSTDGHWHPEWRVRESAIYNNKYQDKPVLMKVVSFYADNPSLFFKIAMAKLVRATSSTNTFLLLAAFLFGCLMWMLGIGVDKTFLNVIFLLISGLGYLILHHLNFQLLIVYTIIFFLSGLLLFRRNMIKDIPFIFPLFILNTFLITFIFYGDARFVYVIEPIAIFSALYFLSSLVKSFFER